MKNEGGRITDLQFGKKCSWFIRYCDSKQVRKYEVIIYLLTKNYFDLYRKDATSLQKTRCYSKLCSKAHFYIINVETYKDYLHASNVTLSVCSE